jgi:micrococcal nuclease
MKKMRKNAVENIPKPYIYVVSEVLKYIDGDTIDVIVDLGFKTFVKKRIRLAGINTPEVRTRNKEEKKRGIAARERLRELIEGSDKDLMLVSHGVGKYGRVLGELILSPNLNVNQTLVSEGHAKEYHGGKK